MDIFHCHGQDGYRLKAFFIGGINPVLAVSDPFQNGGRHHVLGELDIVDVQLVVAGVIVKVLRRKEKDRAGLGDLRLVVECGGSGAADDDIYFVKVVTVQGAMGEAQLLFDQNVGAVYKLAGNQPGIVRHFYLRSFFFIITQQAKKRNLYFKVTLCKGLVKIIKDNCR